MRGALLLAAIGLGFGLSGCGGTKAGGWLTYRDADHGYAVSYPRGWYRSRVNLTPMLVDPRQILALGTYPLRPGGERCAHVPVNALEDLGPTDAFLLVQERSGRPSTEFARRPRHFSLGRGYPSEAVDCVRGSARFAARLVPFRDGGRALYAFVALGRAASAETRRDVLAVLDSLRFRAA